MPIQGNHIPTPMESAVWNYLGFKPDETEKFADWVRSVHRMVADMRKAEEPSGGRV